MAEGSSKPRIEPRKRPKQERSQEMVEAILDATARVLVRDGYDKASTKRVALVAGVSIGSLYQYFPNKESLIAAVFERHLGRATATVRSKFGELEGASLPTAVRELVGAMVELHAVEPELHRALSEQVPRVGRPRSAEAMEAETLGRVRAFLEDHAEEIGPKDLDAAAFVVVQAVESLTHAGVLENPDHLRGERLVEEVSALVLGYLGARRPREGSRR